MRVSRLCILIGICAVPVAATAGCGSLVASVCPKDAQTESLTARTIRLPPRPPAFAQGEVFPVDQHNILMNPERYGLPPVDGPWRYYRIEHEVFRVDNATQEVLEVVTDGNRLLIQ
jgi:hypothetical protein